MPYSKVELNALERHYRPEETPQARPCQPSSSSSMRYASPPRETIARPSETRPRQQPRDVASANISRSSRARGYSDFRSYRAPKPMTGDSIRRSAADKYFEKEHAKTLKRLQERYNQTHEYFGVIQRQFWQEQKTYTRTWVLAGRFPVTEAEVLASEDIVKISKILLDRSFQYEKLDTVRNSNRELYLREKEREEREDIADMKKYMRAAILLTRRRR